MAWFRKKKKKIEEDDEFDDEEELDEEEDRPLRGKGRYAGRLARKKFKDLNPENSRKRKEPPKPWGKKERWIIVILILFTAGISGFLALSAREYKLPGLPRLSSPSFALPSFFGGETIVIEGNAEDNHKSEKAVDAFENKTRELTGVYGLYVVRLSDGSSYGVNENEKFEAASLIKLPVMIGLYMEKEAGRLNLNSTYALKNSDKVGGSGSLRTKPAGYETSYKNLIRMMGKESDNTAYNIAKNYLGDEKIKKIIDEIGMKNTNPENNETTPEDVGILFKSLWEGDLLNYENKNELLSFLTDTIYEEWLTAGVPAGVRVAHKYGREVHVINDAGIVYEDKPYVIVVLSKSISDREGDSAIKEISEMIYGIETESDVTDETEVGPSYLN